MDESTGSFTLENFDLALVPFGIGLVLLLLAGPGVGWFIDSSTRHITHNEDGSMTRIGKVWDQYSKAGGPIGRLESFSFYVAIIIEYPVFIGAWLAFKVAAKWQAWAQIVRLPNLEAGVKFEDKEYLARVEFSSLLHTRFLLGALANILVSAGAAWVYHWISTNSS